MTSKKALTLLVEAQLAGQLHRLDCECCVEIEADALGTRVTSWKTVQFLAELGHLPMDWRLFRPDVSPPGIHSEWYMLEAPCGRQHWFLEVYGADLSTRARKLRSRG